MRRAELPSQRPEPGFLDVQREATRVPRFWRPRDLAGQLGLSRQTIYSLVRRGHLRATHIAGALRISEDAVLAYLAQCDSSGDRS